MEFLLNADLERDEGRGRKEEEEAGFSVDCAGGVDGKSCGG